MKLLSCLFLTEYKVINIYIHTVLTYDQSITRYCKAFFLECSITLYLIQNDFRLFTFEHELPCDLSHRKYSRVTGIENYITVSLTSAHEIGHSSSPDIKIKRYCTILFIRSIGNVS